MINQNHQKRPDFRAPQEEYYRNYISWVTLGMCLLLCFGLVICAKFIGFSFIYLIIFFLIILCLLLFFRVSISIENGSILITYGIGLISNEIIINEIKNCEMLENKYFRTWMFVPNSLYVLKINFRTGGYILIPTDEAKPLLTLLTHKF